MRACLRIFLVSLVFVATGCTYENSVDLPADINNFPPIRTLPKVEAYVGPDAKLVSIEARFVRPDGTLDLEADYKPSLEYTFIQKRKSADDQPVGTGTKSRTYERIEVDVREPGWVHTKEFGGGVNKETTEKHKGMNKKLSFVDGDDWKRRARSPKCDFEKIWSEAREVSSKIPKDAVANITYDSLGYEFTIRDLDVKLYFDTMCKPEDRDTRRERAFEERTGRESARKKAKRRDKEREKRREEREQRMGKHKKSKGR